MSPVGPSMAMVDSYKAPVFEMGPNEPSWAMLGANCF